jgi:xanthine dehydrogenase accessory factor
MKNILFNICALLSDNTPFVLTTIVHKDGSAPRNMGARMIVLSDGNIIDTIGGGHLEAQVIEDALNVFTSGQSMVPDYQLSSMDMICGGRLSVLLEYIEATDDMKALFQKAMGFIQEKKNFMLVTAYSKNAGNMGLVLKRVILTAEGAVVGNLIVPEELQQYWKKGFLPPVLHIEDQNHRYFIESFGTKETVFIFGGGHVAKEIEKLTDMIGMKTVVLDDRKEYANTHRFLSADVIVPENFIKAFEGLDITAGSYIIIVTPDHNSDRDVLRAALKTDAGYIGMIGSTRKRNTIFQSLVSEGIGQDDLKRVHCPIGIDIGSESPQEIAISIVAELISVRRGKTNRAK